MILVLLTNGVKINKKNKIGLYIHIPFCQTKCNYCSFCSITAADNYINHYINQVIKEIKIASKALYRVIDTIYIGGGTPSILNPNLLNKLISKVFRNFECVLKEFTIEANPNTVNQKWVENLKKIGITRISLGLQSTDNKMLKILGRTHDFTEFKNAFYLLREFNLDISIDLMYGLPRQDFHHFEKDLLTAIKLNPKHISLYNLSIEPNTPFFIKKNTLNLPNDDEVADMYLAAQLMLKNAGYIQYEVSNFSKPGKHSKHNLKYWKQKEYLGIGASAHSFLNGIRFNNTNNINLYLNNKEFIINYVLNKGEITKNAPKDVKIIHLGKNELIEEYIMLRLRLTKGINKLKFYKNFNEDLFDYLSNDVKKQIKIGYLVDSRKSLKIATSQMFIGNYLTSRLIK